MAETMSKANFTPWREMDLEARKSALDGLLRHQHKVRRGGAIGTKPNDERRKFVKKWVAFEGEREDTVGEDGPWRLALGGLQDFTLGVKRKRMATSPTMSTR